MYLETGQIIFSPSDLTRYWDSSFASWMEHLAIVKPELLPPADVADPIMAILRDKGNQHETSTLKSFQEKGLNVVDLSKASEVLNATVSSIKSGADIIYQAALDLLPFRGTADFLVKVNGQSLLGNFHYEIWDTKLSKALKPAFIIQLCCYAEMLESVQGRRPENIVVVLGNSVQKRFRTNDYFYYYQNLKHRFLQTHQQFHIENRPDPAASSNWGRWSNFAEELLIQSDHLVQVATITKSQIKKLNKSGISTMQELSDTNLNLIRGMNVSVFQKLKAQARIQKDSIGHTIPLYKILPHELDKKNGLSLLPPHSPLDIFFDIEGYPLEEGGLEYLWGATFFDNAGERQYQDFWAHNHEQERECFKAFIQGAYQRWQKDPTMHIYHYANYEISACRKLMGRYGICEHEVDQLLRNEVFVDLYAIVKNALLLGEPRYSIKNVEHLYREKRDTKIGTGSDSIVAYELWRENSDGETWQTSKILKELRDYNIDDCNSTQELVDWLRIRQAEQGVPYLGKTEMVEPELKDEIQERIRLRDRLLEKALILKAQGQMQESIVGTILGWSIEFHRREAKPIFWKMFDRLGLSDEELLDDLDCLAFCKRTNKPPYKPTPGSRLLAYEYSFDPNQEFKGSSKEYYVLGKETADGKKLKVSFIEEDSRLEQGYIVLKMKNEIDEIITLVPDEYVNPHQIPEAIAKQAEAFEQGMLVKSAILDFLMKVPPRIIGLEAGKPIISNHDPEHSLQQTIQAVINLDNSYLCIQGPPGSGKTYTGKHLIAELIKRGKKIGICSNSHKVINHLLANTAQYCQTENIQGYFACTKKTDDALSHLAVHIVENNTIFDYVQPSCVIGTTAWGFARKELENSFDYLFIDEAGQVSLANLIAISRSTKNIVLLGDQMQLRHPSQGSHPEESGLSVLDYLLHSTPTIPEHMGVFLSTTYRMHSTINKFISDAIYEGKLASASENDRQHIKIPQDYHGILNKEAGIVSVPVEHEGNTQASDEEIAQIGVLANQLLGRIFTAKNGSQKPIGWEDMLFVAPYNHQVNKLKAILGTQAKVGSVDKFQGQEAPIVFLSMCASNANESPRGMNFLFDKNRINVAISRAQCMAIVVYNPSLLEASANTIEQLAMINVFCHLTLGTK